MSLFDTYIMVDWSGGNDRGASPKEDAIWACVARADGADAPVYLRNRQTAEEWLTGALQSELDRGNRVCAGFDFPFGYPRGFCQALTGTVDPLALWDWFEERIEDAPKANNRCQVASDINGLFDGIGPFWGNPFKNREFEHLPRRGLARTNKNFPEKRAVEQQAKGSFACWQMSGVGSVGSQVMMGLPVLARLRRAFAGRVGVWPFEGEKRDICFLEIWPSLIADEIAAQRLAGEKKDAAQVRVLAQAMAALDSADALGDMLALGRANDGEGSIFGVGAEDKLCAAARGGGRLANDCFALPAGVDWTPVEDALDALRGALKPVAPCEEIPVFNALRRVLAGDVLARRANPPAANSAIDGYGFAYKSMAKTMPLTDGRAAAGAGFSGKVPKGRAIRILTGAVLPEGVDTVVMQEECDLSQQGFVRFEAAVKAGQNTREAGEDVNQGEQAFTKGRRLAAQDLALLTALGISEVAVHKPLRVGVLSTGDELVDAGPDMPSDRTFDANRPMLLGLASGWGCAAVDLGHVRDDRDALRTRLNEAKTRCDVVLTSGGASAGDADHVSALLSSEGTLTHWRIAIKPGRPLALAMWDGMPVFGLPGNPVAAFVCSLIFARPALSVMGGAGWSDPQGFMVPAAFSKSKKRGRREYLRARMTEAGAVEVFASEGSGRISGLSWAEGLVELDDGARDIKKGDLVRYLPFGSFGL